eukprot:12388498-Prorocentrum_lima.AAC.1
MKPPRTLAEMRTPRSRPSRSAAASSSTLPAESKLGTTTATPPEVDKPVPPVTRAGWKKPRRPR